MIFCTFEWLARPLTQPHGFFVSTSRIPNIVAIGESPRLLEAIGVAARQSYPGVDVLTLNLQAVAPFAVAAWQQIRPPYVAFLEWKAGCEELLSFLRPAEPFSPLPIWLMVRPGESPGLEGVHVAGSLRVHADMDSLEDRLNTLMDFLKICNYP